MLLLPSDTPALLNHFAPFFSPRTWAPVASCYMCSSRSLRLSIAKPSGADLTANPLAALT